MEEHSEDSAKLSSREEWRQILAEADKYWGKIFRELKKSHSVPSCLQL